MDPAVGLHCIHRASHEACIRRFWWASAWLSLGSWAWNTFAWTGSCRRDAPKKCSAWTPRAQAGTVPRKPHVHNICRTNGLLHWKQIRNLIYLVSYKFCWFHASFLWCMLGILESSWQACVSNIGPVNDRLEPSCLWKWSGKVRCLLETHPNGFESASDRSTFREDIHFPCSNCGSRAPDGEGQQAGYFLQLTCSHRWVSVLLLLHIFILICWQMNII